MGTIEERAKEYAPDPFLAALERKAYIAGATAQKAIDIEKACEVVRNIANEYFGDWEQSCKVEDTFRKAMEE